MAGSLDLCTATLGIPPFPLDLISGAIYWCLALVPPLRAALAVQIRIFRCIDVSRDGLQSLSMRHRSTAHLM
jgi:hypothetical protein